MNDKSVRAVDAVLRVAARHPHLLEEEAFAGLAHAIRDLAPGGRLTVLVPDGPMWFRIYATSAEPTDRIGFGSRIPGVEPFWGQLFVDGEPIVCEDLRSGNEVDRAHASAATLSYVGLPCRVRDPRPRVMSSNETAEPPTRTVAVLVVTYPEPGQQSVTDVAALQEVADAIGPALERAAFLTRQHRLAMILETSSDAMLAWDREGRVTDANAAALALCERSREELVGTPIAELLDPAPEPMLHAQGDGTVRLSLLCKSRENAHSPAPRRVPVAATVTAVEHDALVARHALLRDLSGLVEAERLAAEQLARVHELEEQHRTLLDNAPVIIFRLDPEARELVYLNRHAERLLGVPTAEALATKGFLRAVHADPEGVAAFDAAVARAADGSPSGPYEARFARRESTAIWVRGNVYPLVAEGGRVAAIEGVLADVSAEHAARTRLVQADRLSTLGTLAAGVAHEINNPAAFILLGLDLLQRQLPAPGTALDEEALTSVDETLRELRASIRRIVDIARDLRLFAGAPASEPGQRALVDVKSAVASALSLTRGQILERARLEQHLEDVPPVLVDEGRLGQVIVNLLVNAAQAIPKTWDRDQAILVSTWSDEAWVEVAVEDTGVGIPPEDMGRIWQPFFTTKSPEVGTGLGLSISREIVERAGGTLVAQSPAPETGRGSRFVIRLPAASEVLQPARDGRIGSSKPPPFDARRRERDPARVLIVEDEAALARALAEEIGAEHDVTVAPSADAALELLAVQRFDVVLCDLRMPGMSGEVLYGIVRERDPAQAEAFVFMTGVGFGADLTRFLAECGRVVLEKPFAAQKALDTISGMLRRRASSSPKLEGVSTRPP
jgi:PAS domain S-box-containing protein